MNAEAFAVIFDMDGTLFQTDKILGMALHDTFEFLVAAIIKKYKITKGAVVGDRISDIEAAKDNGLLAIGCRFDFAQEDELVQADFVVNGLVELLSIVEKA